MTQERSGKDPVAGGGLPRGQIGLRQWAAAMVASCRSMVR